MNQSVLVVIESLSQIRKPKPPPLSDHISLYVSGVAHSPVLLSLLPISLTRKKIRWISTERLLTNQTRRHNVYPSQVPIRYPRDVHVHHKVTIDVYDFSLTLLWFQLVLLLQILILLLLARLQAGFSLQYLHARILSLHSPPTPLHSIRNWKFSRLLVIISILRTAIGYLIQKDCVNGYIQL